MGLLHVDALVGRALPALNEQDLVLVLGREVVVIGQAAVLLPDLGQDTRLHDVADEGLTAAGLGRVAHVQDQLFFHVAAPPDFVAPIVAHGGGRCKFFGRGAKNVFTIRII